MAEPEIALVFSPETWVEELHRFVTDHGGARVRSVVVDPAVALDELFGTLVVSSRWPALTHGLVDELHARGRTVLGVYDREEPATVDVLRATGVDATVESDAPMSEFLAVLNELEPRDDVRGRGDDPAASAGHGSYDCRWIAVGGPAGGGATEVAIELARAARGSTVLVDADDVAPAVAARLALPIEPNLRDAIDAVEHDLGAIEHTLIAVPALGGAVLTGLANVAAWSQVRAPEALRTLRALCRMHATVVVDTAPCLEDLPTAPRGRHAVTRAIVAESAHLVAVGDATPVGVVRLLGWIADALALRATGSVHVVLSRAPRDAHRRAQLEAEVLRTFVPETVTCVPFDPRVERAAWSGTPVASGPFRRALAPLAVALADVDSSFSAVAIS